jgi:hypothetical protein
VFTHELPKEDPDLERNNNPPEHPIMFPCRALAQPEVKGAHRKFSRGFERPPDGIPPGLQTHRLEIPLDVIELPALFFQLVFFHAVFHVQVN